jgi:hypothetical protein
MIQTHVSALPLFKAGSVGNDVSWPNCRANQPKQAAFGIVGVTGGLVFAPNPCLVDEAHWFDNPSLYVNTGYAGAVKAIKYAEYPKHCVNDDESCLAYNYGYNAGIYAVYYADSQLVHGTMWWLDVETENSWSENTEYNRSSLLGTADAIKHETLFADIGYYSYPGQWDKITGKWRNGYPTWAASGSEKRQDAIEACGWPSFTGGHSVLAQYTKRLDNDYVCK